MLAAPTPPKRKENKSKWYTLICNDNFYFRQESLWRKDRNMHKGAKYKSELSWRYYEDWVEEISIKCHRYMVYISFFKKLTTYGIYRSSEI